MNFYQNILIVPFVAMLTACGGGGGGDSSAPIVSPQPTPITPDPVDPIDSCVNPHNADIYESYLGVYEVPTPRNTFGDDHVKSMVKAS